MIAFDQYFSVVISSDSQCVVMIGNKRITNRELFFVCFVQIGRGRTENEGIDDVEDYRSRQPSEPALWDFLSTKFPTVKGELDLNS